MKQIILKQLRECCTSQHPTSNIQPPFSECKKGSLKMQFNAFWKNDLKVKLKFIMKHPFIRNF